MEVIGKDVIVIVEFIFNYFDLVDVFGVGWIGVNFLKEYEVGLLGLYDFFNVFSIG